MSATDRVELDVSAERAVGRLRLVGAVVALSMGTVLAVGGAGSVGWALILMSWLVGLAWVGSFVASRRKASRADAFFLELGPDRLVAALGKEPQRVAWRDVRGVDVDEDRLEVVVLHTGGELRLPSVWRGLGPHELAERLRTAGEAAGASLQSASLQTASRQAGVATDAPPRGREAR
ncbi:MAG: hypothetical protein H6721_16290 [Sandaracinus sp.]|nr:hypothetical protein [Myxococcales bacterium]MCB9633678.1 hypothetical protein [Sandaracinus sp.]